MKNQNKKQLLLVTGLSGSGKSLALNFFEDLNFFCVDNLPATLLPQFVQICSEKNIQKIAVGIDTRSGEFFNQLTPSLQSINPEQFFFEILFLEASDEILVRRFSETRRKHPLSRTGRVLEGIHQERELLSELRGMAHKIIDTSSYSAQEFRNELMQLYSSAPNGRPLEVSILSFGYKYGLPLDADLIFDVRFLPNPYYDEKLQKLTGNDLPVKEYVLKQKETQEFLHHLLPLLDFSIPQYEHEGKHHLTIAVGCTGGRHRSIVVANEIHAFLSQKNYQVRVEHRDVAR